jgi:hypothetical protein
MLVMKTSQVARERRLFAIHPAPGYYAMRCPFAEEEFQRNRRDDPAPYPVQEKAPEFDPSISQIDASPGRQGSG